MSGGTISGNQSLNYGGVYVDSNNSGSKGTFTKTGDGGIIYGNEEGATEVLKNTYSGGSSSSAAAVFYRVSFTDTRKRNATLNAADALSTTNTAAGSGWL